MSCRGLREIRHEKPMKNDGEMVSSDTIRLSLNELGVPDQW